MNIVSREWFPSWTQDQDHDQVTERMANQAILDGVDPALAIVLSVEEYAALRDRLRMKRAS